MEDDVSKQAKHRCALKFCEQIITFKNSFYMYFT